MPAAGTQAAARAGLNLDRQDCHNLTIQPVESPKVIHYGEQAASFAVPFCVAALVLCSSEFAVDGSKNCSFLSPSEQSARRGWNTRLSPCLLCTQSV